MDKKLAIGFLFAAVLLSALAVMAYSQSANVTQGYNSSANNYTIGNYTANYTVSNQTVVVVNATGLSSVPNVAVNSAPISDESVQTYGTFQVALPSVD